MPRTTRMTSRWRGVLIVAVTAMLATAMPGAWAAAAAYPPLEATFEVTLDSCVTGRANTDFTIELRAADGAPLQTKPAEVGTGVRFEACFDQSMVAGLRLVGYVVSPADSDAVHFTIPVLTVRTDRVADRVRGIGPANRKLKIRLFDCSRLTFECVRQATRSVTTDAHGKYHRDFTGVFDARGYDEARVTYTSAAGHTYTMVHTFGWMAVVAHDTQVFGEVGGGQRSTFRLRAGPGGGVLSKRAAKGSSITGDYSLRFGSEISTGQQVTGDFASDARLTIPSTTFHVDVPLDPGDDQVVRVRCLPNRKLMFGVNPGGEVLLTADAHGRSSVNISLMLGPGFRLSDQRLRVTCQAASGDVVTRSLQLAP